MARGDSRTDAGAALMEVIWLTLRAGFKLRAYGRRAGFISARGGVWGLLRSLKDHGPLTVPALARMRPVSRQHIQTLADAMAADGLVAFRTNPAHRRSPLVAMTPKGQQVYEALARKLAAVSDELAADMDARKIAHTAESLDRLVLKLDALLGDVDEDEETPKRKRARRTRS